MNSRVESAKSDQDKSQLDHQPEYDTGKPSCFKHGRGYAPPAKISAATLGLVMRKNINDRVSGGSLWPIKLTPSELAPTQTIKKTQDGAFITLVYHLYIKINQTPLINLGLNNTIFNMRCSMKARQQENFSSKKNDDTVKIYDAGFDSGKFTFFKLGRGEPARPDLSPESERKLAEKQEIEVKKVEKLRMDAEKGLLPQETSDETDECGEVLYSIQKCDPDLFSKMPTLSRTFSEENY